MEKMDANQKSENLERSRMANGYSKRSENQRTRETAIYLVGKIEQLCADYARSTQTSEIELAATVADIFYSQTRGPVLGAEDHLSAVREDRPRLGRPPRSMEVVGVSHRNGTPPIEVDDLSREQVVVELLKQKFSVPQIAERMDITPATVRTYAHRQGVSVMGDLDRHSTRGYKYRPGTHWTQQRKNQKKMVANMHKAAKAGRKAALAHRRKNARPPGTLTPREKEVLELDKQGLDAKQIGEKLGISYEGALFHLRNLRKAGVALTVSA
jgi:DNA-binding NarL/FixJ family response regulator